MMILMVKFKYKKDQRKNYINNKTFKFKMIDLKKIIENSYSILFSFYLSDIVRWGWVGWGEGDWGFHTFQ